MTSGDVAVSGVAGYAFWKTVLQMALFSSIVGPWTCNKFLWLVIQVIIGKDGENTVRAAQLTAHHCTPQAYECEASLMKHESSKQRHNSVCRVWSVCLSLPLPLPLRLGEKDLKR